MRWIAAIVVALVLGLVATTYLLTRPPERGLTSSDLSWVRSYVDWRDDLWYQLAAAHNGLGRGRTLSEDVRLLDPIRRCSQSYLRNVRAAPEPLRFIDEATRGACEDGEQAAAVLNTLGDSGLKEAKTHLFEAYSALERGAIQLDKRLVMTRPLPSAGGRTTESRVEPRFSRVATRITGLKMEVRCWSKPEWAEVRREAVALNPEHPTDSFFFGVAGIWGGAANLWPGVCAELVRFAYGRRLPTSHSGNVHLIDAFVTLGHEAAHASGVVNEFEAECVGHQHVRAIARQLGASQTDADRLASLGWKLYGNQDLGSPQLWSPRCRDGGPFDLRQTHRWP